MKVTYRGIDATAAEFAEDAERVLRNMAIQADGLSIGNGETQELTPAQLKQLLEIDPKAVFDVEPSAGKKTSLGPLARELEKRGVSVHPDLGGSQKPKGHRRWEAE